MNNFVLNGKRLSIKPSQNEIIMVIENYASGNVQQFPIHIPYEGWREEYCHKYLEIYGHFTSTEVAAHDFEYCFIADNVIPSDALSVRMNPKNKLECTGYLAQEPRFMLTSYPHHAMLYLGSGKSLKNGYFYGHRFHFNLSLLRLNTDQAKGLKTGDVIRIESTLVNSDKHGVQIIGKKISIV